MNDPLQKQLRDVARNPELLKMPMKSAVRLFRTQLIVQAVEDSGGNNTAAAKKLGITRQTICNHIRRA